MIASRTLEMTTQRVTPQNVLGKLHDTKVLNQDTLAALKVAFDPCHDTPIDFRGKPTVNTQNVFCWNDVGSVAVNIGTSDVTLDNTQPFSVCISTYPIGQPAILVPATTYGNIAGVSDLQPQVLMSPVTITYSQGVSFPNFPLLNGNPGAVSGLSPNPNLCNEKTDVCGWGVEVVNVTPMLNIGGTLTTASIPQFDQVDHFAQVMCVADGPVAGEIFGPFEVRPIACCPTDEASLLQFQGSKQWNAKEGAYCPVPINWVDYTESPFPCGPIALVSSMPTQGFVTQPCFLPSRANVSIGATNVIVQPRAYSFLNCDSQCIMLTGLDPKTELTVRFKFWGMTEPKSNVVQLRAAKPPVPWDDEFLKFATMMKRTAPTSTYFTDNPSGEWWKKLLGTAAELAPSILSMIPHPAARALAPVAQMAAPMFMGMAAESATKRKAKNANGKYGQGMKKNKTGHIVPRKPKKAVSGNYEVSKAPPALPYSPHKGEKRPKGYRGP